MRARISRLCAVIVAALFVLVARDALGHGGQHRGPAGQVPPDGRVPTDPTAPTVPPSGPTPAPTFPPGTTPGPGGRLPGGGPHVGPRVGPTGGQAGRTGVTPGPRKQGRSTPGFERWEFWWTYNRERFLDLKRRLNDRIGSTPGGADWLLGRRTELRVVERITRRVIDDELLPALLARLTDEHFDVRAAAVIALGKAGDVRAVEPLVDALGDSHKQVSESAALALGILGEKAAISVLRELLIDSREGRKLVRRPQEVPFRTRAFAAIALGLIGDASAAPDLLDAVRADSRHRDLPSCAAVGLALMGAPAGDAVPALLDLVRSGRSSDVVRAHAINALGKIGDRSALSTLQKALRDKSLHVRRSAVQALGRVARADDAVATRMLVEVVRKGRDPQSVHWGCIALGRIGGAMPEKTLTELVVRGNGQEQAFAAIGLAMIAARDGERDAVSEHLRRGLESVRDTSVQGAFCIALAIAGDRGAAPRLRAILRSSGSPALRGHAALALGILRDTESKPLIREIVSRKRAEPDLLRDGATALGLLGDREVVSLLSDMVRSAKTEHIKSASATALGFIGDHSAVGVLREVAADAKTTPDLARAHAVVALGIVGEEEPLPVLSRVSEGINYRALVEALNEILSIT